MATPHRNRLVKPRVPKSERPALFLVRYAGGGSVPMTVPAVAAAWVSSRIPEIARQRQARGELPAGTIAAVVRVR
jgi:hypothetical protein